MSLWTEDHAPASTDRLRKNLMGSDAEAALVAAVNLPMTVLSLPEIHRQVDLLLKHTDRFLAWAGCKEDGFWWTPGMNSIGSGEVIALYGAAVDHDPEGKGYATPDYLHRVTVQDQIPALAALLGPARGFVFRQIFWNFRLLADNSDRHHDAVEEGLLFVRAALLAEAEGRAAPDLSEFHAAAAGPGIPESLRLLVRAPWGIGDEPLQGAFFVPGNWIDRWLLGLRPGPSDLPFLEEVAWKAPFDGLHEEARIWAARTIAAIGGPEPERILRELEADGWKVREWLARAPEASSAPEALTAAEARALADAWGRAPATAENVDDERGWKTLLLMEAAAPEALDGLLRTWAAVPQPFYGDHIAAARIRRGDPAAVAACLAPPGSARDYWRIGRSRDPRVREHLEGLVRTGDPDHGYALAGLALWHGLPEPLAESIPGTTPSANLVLQGLPAKAVLLLAEADDYPEERIARLGLLGEAARPILERVRRERHRGLYWQATAGLAMAGDPEAREEFLSLLREDRIGLWDEWFDPVACSLNGDPEALAYWRSRVGANCCLWNYASRVLARWYPTMPAEVRTGDPDGLEERCRLWWQRWKDRLRWSRLADGWVPAAD